MIITALAAGVLLNQATPQRAAATPEFYSQVVKDLDNKDFAFKSLKGKVVLVVNTASLCGLTPQYKGLEKLWRDNKKAGLMVVGFPSNDFNNQEPGTNEEIKTFCTQQFDVTFPMMSKVKVKRPDIHPLYEWLQSKSDRPAEEVEWNFAKFLVDRNGVVRYRFAPKERPESPFVMKALNELLAEKAK